MTRPSYKWALFWVTIVVALLATPSLLKVIQLHVYDFTPDPKPEDFYVIPDQIFQGFERAPESEVKITESPERVFVDAIADGYTLTLSPKMHAYTRAIESRNVHVTDDCGDAIIIKLPFKTAQEAYEDEIQSIKNDPGLKLLDSSLKKIPDTKLEAYLSSETNDAFGIENEILIEGENSVFSITQAPKECTLMQQVLEGFSLK